MKTLIDTNVYINALKGNQTAQKLIIESDLVMVPFIVLGELEYGFRNGSKYQANKDKLKLFLEGPNCFVIHSSEHTIAHYGRIKNRLKEAGNPIPENDIWIAALAIETNAQLLSFDQHFLFIEHLDFQHLTD